MQERAGHRPQQASKSAQGWRIVWLGVIGLAWGGLVAAAPPSRSQPTTRAAARRAKAPKPRPASRPASRRQAPDKARPSARRKSTIPALPPGIGPINFPPLPKTKRRKRPRRRYQRPPVIIPTITPSVAKDPSKLNAIIDQLKKRNWRLQGGILSQLIKAQGAVVKRALHQALKHKHLRVRLLVAQALGERRDPVALPLLLRESRRLYDQPGSLLMGAWMAYGPVAGPLLRSAISQKGRPHQLLRALGYLRLTGGHKLLVPFLRHQDKGLREIAREALRRYSAAQMVEAIQIALKQRTKPATGREQKAAERTRAALVRMLSYRPTAQGMALLIEYLRDPSGAIRFLARISAKDQADEVHKAAPQRVAKPPKSRAQAAWQAWWHKHKAAVAAHYQKKARQAALASLPSAGHRTIRIMYRTIHPVFGYGRMPLVVHDASWKKPTPTQPGKLWYVPLPHKQFAALLQQLQGSGFFRWNPRMGQVRDITVYVGQQRRRVSIGMVRHLGFERLEQTFLALAKRKKLGLNFYDFYNRRDEADVIGEGQIGQWAYRAVDVLPTRKWTPRKGWKPAAHIEGVWAALRDLLRYLPSRTRLISADIQAHRLRLSTLLYGSRDQSKKTRQGVLRSRRMYGFRMLGLGPIHLSMDKIEQMIFELRRRPFPWTSRSSPKQGRDLPLLSLFKAIWPARHSRVLALRFDRGRPHRLYARWKTRSSRALLQSLAQLAVRSRGDRLLGLRINPSGRSDRQQFPLIVQMQWEMMTPLQAPKQLPPSLRMSRPAYHEPFSPVYR